MKYEKKLPHIQLLAKARERKAEEGEKRVLESESTMKK
jgi:hypothetical protein